MCERDFKYAGNKVTNLKRNKPKISTSVHINYDNSNKLNSLIGQSWNLEKEDVPLKNITDTKNCLEQLIYFRDFRFGPVIKEIHKENNLLIRNYG